MKSLYIHIPFCDSICNYCDFPKRVATDDLKEKYISYLIKELELYEIPSLKTIYIGGGTPSSLSLDLIDLLTSKLPEVEEFTFECNPNDINDDLLKLLIKNGVTRLSLGVQTFNSDLLKDIGRTHNSKDVDTAIKLIKKYTFDLSIDMIFNLPNQDEEMLRRDLEMIRFYEIEHISYYSLILEPNTVFEKWIDKGKMIAPDKGDLFFEKVLEEMANCGYKQYEISNYTKGHKSLHNLTYWNNDEYVGVGLAASGYINGERYSNVRMFSEYFSLIDVQKKPIKYTDVLSKNDIMYEHLMLGFRKLEGIDIEDFENRYDISIYNAFSELEKLVSEEYLEVINGKIRITRKGLFFNNDMLVRLL